MRPLIEDSHLTTIKIRRASWTDDATILFRPIRRPMRPASGIQAYSVRWQRREEIRKRLEANAIVLIGVPSAPAMAHDNDGCRNPRWFEPRPQGGFFFAMKQIGNATQSHESRLHSCGTRIAAVW